MKILLKYFNPTVTGKGGHPLKKSKFRDRAGWLDFEDLLFNSLKDHNFCFVPDNLDILHDINFDIMIKQHGDKTLFPSYDFFYMQMFHKFLFEFDHNGWGCLNSKFSTYDANKNYINKLSLDKLTYLRNDLLSFNTKHKQKRYNFLKNKLPDDYIFVPLQTPNDYVIKKFSPISVYKFIFFVGEIAKSLKLNFVLKIHPFAMKDKKIISIITYLLTTNKYIFLSDDNVIKLVYNSNSVFIINSGVGFESLLLSKPVYTVGTCIFKSITNHINLDIKRLNKQSFTYPFEFNSVENWLCWYLSCVSYLVLPEYFDENSKRINDNIDNYVKHIL